MGFAAACDVKVGDRVTVGGFPREVVGVRQSGRDWPYFQLRSDRQTAFELGGPDWVSWQTCGAVVPAAPRGWDHV